MLLIGERQHLANAAAYDMTLKGSSLVVRIPPHPSPLPQGRGGRKSPRPFGERARVRGRETSRKHDRSTTKKLLYSPPVLGISNFLPLSRKRCV